MLDSNLLPVSLRASAAVAGAFIIGAYVLFGSPTDITSRRRRKKDVIPGLANIGNSCFLNALVQSLASCPLFISWLRSKYSSTCPPLVSALHNLLQVLNNEDGGEGDACAGQVLGALRGHGWVISSEEQDTHELFHVLTSTIDDELTTASSVASLLDVAWLDVSSLSLIQEGVALKADSWQHTITGNAVMESNTGVKECLLPSSQDEGIFSKLNGVLKDDSQSNEPSQISSETETRPESKGNVGEGDVQEIRELSCDMVRCSGGSVKQDSGDDIEMSSCDNKGIKDSSENKTLANHVPDLRGNEKDSREATALIPMMESLTLSCNKSESLGEDSTAEVKKFPGVVVSSRCPSSDSMGGWRSRGEQHDIPFRGYLASQLQCTFCGYKNPAQWTSFESLSLSLPPVPWGEVALTELLDAYITPEKVTDVSCDGCSRRARTLVKTTFTKQLTIGKLPDCLCFHIKRTVWLENGSAIKRRDHLTFPEFLVMDPYTYTTSITLQGDQKASSGKPDEASSISSALGNKYQHMISTSVSQRASSSHQEPRSLIPISRVKFEQLYRLRAVIVHVGDVFCGHFVTYRRGPISSRAHDRWFYTSDLLVRDANLEEVQKANAYMILYEKVI